MDALQQLADKSKDSILPIIPLKPWATSKSLSNTVKKINTTFGDRKVIVDIDLESLVDYRARDVEDIYRDVFQELELLTSSNDGYINWFNFISANENFIPVVQLADLTQIDKQLLTLSSLNRGLVFRFDVYDIDYDQHLQTLNRIASFGFEDMLIVYDYGQITRDIFNYMDGVISLVTKTSEILHNPMICVSSTSFPSSFKGISDTDFSIIERLLFNKLRNEVDSVRLIYSDWGSARADKIGGGGRIPPPRIDYPLRDEWMILRSDFDDVNDIKDGEKNAIYTHLASMLLEKNYWNQDLHVWGTQLIELTAKGDSYGINSAQRATAARINIHLHQQLNYDSPDDLTDTDEMWVD